MRGWRGGRIQRSLSRLGPIAHAKPSGHVQSPMNALLAGIFYYRQPHLNCKLQDRGMWRGSSDTVVATAGTGFVSTGFVSAGTGFVSNVSFVCRHRFNDAG